MQCHHWTAADGDHQYNHSPYPEQGAHRKAGIHETEQCVEVHQLVRQARNTMQ